MAVAGHGQTAKPCCDLFQCFCCWRAYCSDSVHRFAPGMDYLGIQDGADDGSPTWSVLVGCTCADEKLHNLRLHRFGVASSGRVFGHSNDVLELFSSVHPKEHTDTVFADATASLAPGGGRLNIICSHSPVPEPPRKISISDDLDLPPKAVTLDLFTKTLSPETPLPFLHGAYHAVSAHGEFWAAAVVVEEECPDITWRLVVHRLASGGDRWDEVASYNFPERPEPVDGSLFSGIALPGYAVLNDKFILLSLIDSTFFCFNCATGTLTRVPTTRKASMYVRISDRAVHVQGSEDDDGAGTIYFVDCARLFAYKYMPEEGMPLEPPVMVDTLWPYYREGNGFIVQLAGQMLCAVWINMNEACSCSTRHALITTFSVSVTKPKDESSSVVHAIEVLHSTCRTVDMIRDESLGYHHYDTFAILQEYPDHAANVYDTSQPEVSGGFSHPVEDSQDILTCCRNYLRAIGKLVWTADSLVDCKVVTKRDLYFICQVDQLSFLYQISTSRGKLTCDERVLEPKLRLDTVRDGGVSVDIPATWHFVHRGSELFVIASFPHHPNYKVDVSSMSYNRHLHSRTRHGYFSAVFRVGRDVVALGEKLMDVYILDEETSHWDYLPTSSRTLDLEQKVKISGYVELVDKAFLISDVDTDKSFFLDLGSHEWVVVEPPKVNDWFGLVGLLSGRCIFVGGFIYTCADEGLVAYELLKEDSASYGLGTPISLEFPWREFSDRRFMSFECIGMGSKGIVFCVIEGHFLADPFTSRHSLTSTTVIVECEDTPQGSKVPVRLNHVDVAVSSVNHEDRILTNYAFAL